MATLWGGRFEKNTDEAVFAFNASISFDKRLLRADIGGSKVHAEMLARQGILTEEEEARIQQGLDAILSDVEEGRLEVSETFEDVHSFVESELTDRIGEPGKKLHTGRSRNDQVALDMKLFTRQEAIELDACVKALMQVIQQISEAHIDTIMPGFTHLQKAQPITLAHHLNAYFEMFKRDRTRLRDLLSHMDTSPLGSGALAGTTYPLDREWTAKALGFAAATANSIDGVSDRDYLIELLSALSIIMMHLSRFCEEMILWNTDEYRFIELDDAFSTGSSIMPQKKNPDIAELVRGKTGRVYGALVSMLVTMKGLPLAYNKDMQEDKEPVFDAIDTTKACLTLFAAMLASTKFNTERMRASASGGFTNATDLADYLVGKGVPFRDAHGIVGQVVLSCIERKKSIEELSLSELRAFSEVIDEDVYDAISLETCVNRRETTGAPGKTAMERALEENRRYLEKD
ncbi:MAG: argininosuccinate lyase [Lachnospiraceae bacterium]|nr:argininosuccinate lyase [Lachnospiraceae bacterium]